MKKFFYFTLGIIATFVIIAVVVKINFQFNSHKEIIVIDVDSADLPADTLLFPDDRTEEEFTREMMKGVQGDLTLEQLDSMQRSWAEQDSIEKVSH